MTHQLNAGLSKLSRFTSNLIKSSLSSPNAAMTCNNIKNLLFFFIINPLFGFSGGRKIQRVESRRGERNTKRQSHLFRRNESEQIMEQKTARFVKNRLLTSIFHGIFLLSRSIVKQQTRAGRESDGNSRQLGLHWHDFV